MRLPVDGTPLYRDSENGMLLGVCAGVADYLDTSVLLVRVVAVLVLIFLFIPAVLSYLIAGLLLREPPLRYRGSIEERWFWGGRRGGV
ncbi:MAG: PspC domain-containing protein [Gammaproteobacteria bacterium]|nr:PspC domain-containing protein [Gammaproteobacteria bacterium]